MAGKFEISKAADGTFSFEFKNEDNRKPICRLYLNSPTNKRITFIGEDKKEQHNKITSIDDIYNYTQQIINAAIKYI